MKTVGEERNKLRESGKFEIIIHLLDEAYVNLSLKRAGMLNMVSLFADEEEKGEYEEEVIISDRMLKAAHENEDGDKTAVEEDENKMEKG